MSSTSIIGALGVGRQSAKDVLASSFTFIPATSIGLNKDQQTQTLPAEVGGDYFLRGSYKSSVRGAGDAGMVVRPNSIGNLLYMLAGQDTVTGVPGQSGAYQHVFTPFTPQAGVDLPWFSLLKDVGKIWGEQYLNAKLRSFRLDVPKASIVTAQASLLATTPSDVAITSSSGNNFVGGIQEVFDSTPQFQTCNATVSIATESPSPALTFSSRVERFSFDFNNNLSEDEFSVGNFYLDDITLLQRTAQVNMDIVVRDQIWERAVYLNGGTIPNAWNPAVYRGALTVTLTSTGDVPSTTQPYSLALTFPGLDFLMAPVTESGAELIRTTVSTQVTLGPSGGDRFTATLINGVASY